MRKLPEARRLACTPTMRYEYDRETVDTAYLPTVVILYIGRIAAMGCEKLSRGNPWRLSSSPENKITSGSE